ncbi:hypothetical protein BVG79_00875 [Ketogulonicigenium robustum]|uniref:DUF192 domain-containing protein n=2 Tax=Ketogulonicigenium robustum TaxID=92947 RepID=A0A1W6NYX5_9RHOB|nr:DUF192 domain-containing protein [Ketogulonicigenium robustum]ARO14227.1 hypothetical protein BVG79_00875 [Ketogulonicigenium robustum]
MASGAAAQGEVAPQCDPNVVYIQKHDSSDVPLRFLVSVADTNETRAQGLMFVPQMPDMAGMLFVYDQPETPYFWMRNTLIPLDMVFASPEGVVTHIHPNAIPRDETAIPGGPNVQFVLEINGGQAAALGLSEGDRMIHPSIGESCN